MKINQTKNYVITDDTIKNIVCGILVLIFLIILIIVSELCYRNLILAPFIVLVPAILLSIKWSYILLHRGITNKPICTFSKDGIIIPNYFKSNQLLKYQSIHNIRVISTNPQFVDILIHSDEVNHPSKNLHLRLHYPFKKELLQENIFKFTNACSNFKLKFVIEEHENSEK